ncbi:MAG TPA: cyclase family protein [Dehalococcoidia bacterium]|nr:cyclase family protein [Dehalococcoidia bacterium]
MINDESTRLPTYQELLQTGRPAGSNWGVFGADDQLGCLNHISPAQVAKAASLVRKGLVFSLNLPLEQPDPPLYGRGLPEHHLLTARAPIVRDDYVNNLWPQTSSQWDGLRHIRHPQDGFYNGAPDETIISGEGGKLGIEQAARRGIVARAVLLDVERHLSGEGQPFDQTTSFVITPELLAECAEREAVAIEPGDVLLIHTGWLHWWQQDATAEYKTSVSGKATAANLKAPGLGPAEAMTEFLWDHRIAAVASDNPALEAWPPGPGTGFLHPKLLAHLGMMIGELWQLDALAADCAADGVCEFMLTSAPWNLAGGVGSPANAIAIK